MAVTPQFRYSSGALRLLGVQPELRLDGPEIGAVVVWDHGGGMGHVGLVEALGPDLLHTIEGNTNDEGSREGYEVCRRQRHVKDGRIAGYLKIC